MSTPPQGASPGALALLVFQGGPRYGQELSVTQPVATVGRAAGSDLVIDDDSVSAAHARLEYDAGAWRLTDLESTNGTTVEGVRLAPHVPTPVHAGMHVRFGGVALLFRGVRDADPEQAREAYVPPPVATTLREERVGFRLPVWVVVVALLAVLLLVGTIVMRSATRSAGTAPRPAPTAPAPARAGP
jgi:pSer/pThr/pTyr-binding forkhead associated (FHA) protein